VVKTHPLQNRGQIVVASIPSLSDFRRYSGIKNTSNTITRNRPKRNTMKLKSNIVSLLMGAVLGAVAVLTIAAATSTQPLTCGRFQLVVADSYVYKIDTSTGQVWQTSVHSMSKDFKAPNLPAPEIEK
jgi:hypothetical protein